MNESKPRLSLELGAGLFVALVGLVVGKLIEHISNEAFLLTIALTVSSIVITGLISQLYSNSLNAATAKKLQEELRIVVEQRLEPPMKAVADLSQEAQRAATYLQASNSSSDLRQILLTTDDIKKIETSAREKIFVVTRDLGFDQQIEATVIHNLRSGKEYCYFHPEGSISEGEISKFKVSLALDPESLKRLTVVAIPKNDYNFPTDLVIYDPHKKIRCGYLRLPTDELPGGLRAIILKEAEQLVHLSELLERLLKQHRPQASLPIMSSPGKVR